MTGIMWFVGQILKIRLEFHWPNNNWKQSFDFYALPRNCVVLIVVKTFDRLSFRY